MHSFQKIGKHTQSLGGVNYLRLSTGTEVILQL